MERDHEHDGMSQDEARHEEDIKHHPDTEEAREEAE